MSKKNLIITLLFALMIFAVNLGKVAEAKRIISLAPNITEILFILGADKQLVGVTENCDFPKEAKKIEKIGLFGSPNLEKIISLKPDLVLAANFGQNTAILRLKSMGVKTIVLSPQNIKDILDNIESIGGIIGRKKTAEILVGKMQMRINEIKNKVFGLHRPKVLVIIWVNSNSLMTAGKKSFINELISISGGKNIAGDINVDYPTLNPEFIMAKNPEIVIFGDSLNNEESIRCFLAQPGSKNIRAVKSGRIYYKGINPDLFLRPGPRIINGLEEIAKTLHPEIFPFIMDERRKIK
ncbi:MAG: iron complex transport system substrate-binding protein [Candidatus Saganbacteria bacterium]|uniref:Iron complex transport system substrate-binding protein n=1 Tax=Candidatus Saganbacteria bacterium TaxID=2575572 RepID=A0A833L226_UNCSA|nr:MAG: iron complex transport system substrate-binding protein [Candidatus Saganbacteria bacterium]